MLIANGRAFLYVTVAEFMRLRLASLLHGPYGGPELTALVEFLQEHKVNLGQLYDLEKHHDRLLGPEFFNRPHWTAVVAQ